MDKKTNTILKTLRLKPHPEGGYFKETYRSSGIIKMDSLEESYKGSRNYSTAIYFLLTSGNFSALHRIKQDEIWHFYDGSPLKLHVIHSNGRYNQIIIGKDIQQGQVPQFVVEGGCWFGAEVIEEESFSLVGCTVSPGFSFDDFELRSRKELTVMFPEHLELINRLTRH